MPQDFLTDPYTEVYECDPHINPLELMDRVFAKSFCIPSKAVQQPLMMSALLTRSSLCSVLPLLVSYGPSGTGKSQLGKLAAGLYDLPSNYVLAGKTTAVAIRNLIQAQKFGDEWVEVGESEERDCFLIWDDINLDILKDPYLLSILKSGYSRRSANIGIAQAGGSNLYFNCFSSKFTSTIHPFWSYGDFVELARRILIFPHLLYDEFTEEDRQNNPDPEDLIDLDYVTFEGYKEMRALYPDVVELQELRKVKRKLKSLIRSANVPNSFAKVCFDILSFGILYGVYETPKEAVLNLERFYQLMKEPLEEKTEFDYWLDRFLRAIIEVEKDNKVTQLNGVIELSRSQLQNAIDKAIKDKEIPQARYELAKVMKQRGWRLVSENRNKFERPL